MTKKVTAKTKKLANLLLNYQYKKYEKVIVCLAQLREQIYLLYNIELPDSLFDKLLEEIIKLEN